MSLGEAYKGYTSTMWDRLSTLATWQPDVPLSVGDVVTAGAGGVSSRAKPPSLRSACPQNGSLTPGTPLPRYASTAA